MALSKIEKKTLAVAVSSGFTFAADSHFVGYMAAKRALSGLVKKGYLQAETDKDGRTSYTPTEAARDYVAYGIEAGEVA